MVTYHPTVSAVGRYVLGNVQQNASGNLLVQHFLASGTGMTFCFRKRITGGAVADADAPRCAHTDALTNLAVLQATDITPTTAVQLHSVPADGCDIILHVLTNSGSAVLTVELATIATGN